MRSETKYLHNLANLRQIDRLNTEIESAESIEPALTRSVAHETRRAAEAPFTASERAWFRKAIGAAVLALVMAMNVHNAGADTAKPERKESAALVSAKRDVQAARDHLKDVRASERQIKAVAHDAKRAAKLRADLAKVEARIASERK